VPPPEPVPSVAVIVVNWNGTDDTLECLDSLMHMEYPRCEIIVVDNASQPSPRAVITERFPAVTYIDSGANLGYAGGNNVGMRRALARGHDYVFVLNNDTVVEADVLRKAVAVATSDPRIGVVGVKVIAFDDPGRVWVAYGQVTYRQGLVRLIGYYGQDDGTYDEQKDVEWVPGTAMLFSRRALEAVGLFDDNFFAYHEDVDWCTAARKRGFRVVFAPQPRIYHKGHQSSGGKGYVTPRQYLAGRNMVLYVRKHASALQVAKFVAFQVGTVPLQYVRRWLKGEQAGVTAKVRGMLDGLRGTPLCLEKLGLGSRPQ